LPIGFPREEKFVGPVYSYAGVWFKFNGELRGVSYDPLTSARKITAYDPVTRTVELV